MTTTVHVFYYRWPRIKEGLTHKELPTNDTWPEDVRIPAGGFMWCYGRWWQAMYLINSKTITKHIITEEKVPKDIRALALIVI